jgi:hypothetical protein
VILMFSVSERNEIMIMVVSAGYRLPITVHLVSRALVSHWKHTRCTTFLADYNTDEKCVDKFEECFQHQRSSRTIACQYLMSRRKGPSSHGFRRCPK